ncbi:hypothetical protein [Maricaulis sp.]|uniref:hypothetical protein n=1 Tax=Maricaulis sp. TaxID=1486257 RepID=UPI003297D06C
MATKRRNTSGDAVQSIQDVTPHDTNAITGDGGAHPTALFIGEAGLAITIKDMDGNTITFAADTLAVGVWHRMAFTHVMNTDTGAFTAGNIKAGWCGWVSSPAVE